MAVLPELRNGDTTPESGSSAEHAGADQQHLEGDEAGQAEPEEEAVVRAGAQGRAQRARHQEAEQQEDSGHTQEAPLFADGGQHEIGIAGRDHGGVAPAGAGADRAAGGEAPERMRQLVAAVDVVIPGESHMSMRSTTVCGCPRR